MKANQLDSSLRSQIDSFIARIRELVNMAALGSVQAALTAGVPGVARRGPGRPRGRRKTKRGPGRPKLARPASGRRVRRSSSDLDQLSATILAYVRSHPGERLEEIGRGLRRDTSGLKRPIQMLLAEKKVRTEGQKRGTRYFAGGRSGKAAAKPAKAKRKAAKKARRGGARRKGARKARRPAASKPKARPVKAGGKRARGRRAAATVTLRPVKPAAARVRAPTAAPQSAVQPRSPSKISTKAKVAVPSEPTPAPAGAENE